MVVALVVVLAGMVAILFLGRSEKPVLQIPETIGPLVRTPSEEVSTSQDLIATYTSAGQVALLSVTRTSASDVPMLCTPQPATPSTQCSWTSEGLSYTVVGNTADAEATAAFAAQAEHAVRAINS
jgi:hypothetical protein